MMMIDRANHGKFDSRVGTKSGEREGEHEFGHRSKYCTLDRSIPPSDGLTNPLDTPRVELHT